MTYAIVCAAAYFGIGLALFIGALVADESVQRNQVAPLFIALLLAGPFVLFALLVDKMRYSDWWAQPVRKRREPK